MQKVCQNELLLLLQKQIFKLIIFYLAKVKAQILSNKLEKSQSLLKADFNFLLGIHFLQH